MTQTSIKRPWLLVLFAVCSLAACGKKSSPSAKAGGPELPPDAVVAKVGSESITLAQVDEEARSELSRLDEQRFQIRKAYLDKLIDDRLVKAEAQKRNVTPEQLLKTEVEDKIPQPSEEQVQQLFKDSAAQLPPGASIEDFRPQIVQYLTRAQKQEKQRELMTQLRKGAGVEVKFSQPRRQVEAKGPSRGPDDAKVTIITFSDFECPFCGRAKDTVDQVMQAYAGKVRLVFRQFPLSFHPHAAKSAEASLCANEQGKFWEYHDELFKNQKSLEVPQLKEHAKSVGLEAAKFDSCLDGNKFADQVKEDLEAGKTAGVSGTPAFFVNGIFISGAQPFDAFKRIIDEEIGG